MYNMYRTGIGGGADVTSSHLTSLGPIASYGHPLAAGLTARYGSTHGHLPGYNSPMTNVTANSRMPYENVHNINPGVSDGNKDVSGSVNREVSSANTNRDVLRDENYGQTFPTSRSTMSADRSSPVGYLPSSSSPVYSSSGSPSQDINNVDTSSTLSFESDASHSDGGPQSKQRKTVAKGAPYIPSYMDLSNGPEPCVVCSDAATGYHYRCMTCEGCKGFFRRTIQKNLQYHCKWNKTCVIDKTTRNQCQECRFIKCIQVGMATDLVLNERQRTAKRKLIEDNRERRKEDTVKMKVREYTDSQEVLTDYDRGLICEVVTAYEFTAGKTKSKSNGEYDRLGAPGDGVQTADPESWQNLADAMTPSIVKVVEFAKGVPGFIQLNVDDQILLLKSCCMEIMCLRVACKFDPDTETLTLNNGTQIHKSQIHHGNLAVLIEPIFEFAIGLARLKLDKAEVALLAAVLLMQSDRSGLQEPEAVEKLQDSILGAFKRYIAENRPYQPVHWAKILMKVTDLRTISTRHAERVLCIRLDNSGEIPPLLLEVFNEGSAS